MTELNAEQGEVVVSGTMNNPASVIGTVADLSEILAEVDVDETEVVDVRPGLPAEVVVDALPDVRYAGEVVEVGSSGYTRPAQPDVQFFRVKILLSAPDERLRPGMFGRGEIAIGTGPASLVPLESVVSSDGYSYVFVLSEDNIVARRRIETGAVHDGSIEVVGGVEPGERIVNKGAGFLKDGDRVTVSNPVGGS